VVEHLLNRYGSMSDDLLALIAADPAQAEPLPGNPDYLRAEVTYAVTHEGALHVEDVLARRTRYNIETRDRGIEASVVVAKIMGGLLGWSAAEEKAEARNYRLSVEAELAAEQQSTDEAANALRTAVPSITELPPQ
jgi:glycerol-3-phosphate dehydrogenase